LNSIEVPVVRHRVVLWIKPLPTTGDPLNHTKKARVFSGIQDQPLLSKVALASAAVCPAFGVKCSARRASQVHRAREEVRDGIATAENRDSYADI
jgi:hypothetical protein